MPRIAIAVGAAIGLAAAIVVYLAFLAHEFVKASRANVALGVGIVPYVVTRPAFLIAAAAAFALAFYKVLH